MLTMKLTLYITMMLKNISCDKLLTIANNAQLQTTQNNCTLSTLFVKITQYLCNDLTKTLCKEP